MPDNLNRLLSEQDIDDIILAGGHRNAAGGIYATSVYAFAKEVAHAGILADRETRKNQPTPRERDMAMLIKRMMRFFDQHHTVYQVALDYLRRHGLDGSPMRKDGEKE